MRITSDGVGNIFHYNSTKQFHREDGPALILASGTKEWYRNGVLHREDGPAVERHNNVVSWWLYGMQYDFDAYCYRAGITNEQKILLLLKYDPHTVVSHDF